jgi:GNAT superfamily N-acetyltransferase
MVNPDCALRYAGAEDLAAIEPLWRALYAHQAAHGMRLPVPAVAFEAWAASMSPALGRFTVVALAERDGVAAGFVAGRVRALPAYFGGGSAGFISEVYVSGSERGSGIGRRLLAFALDWFAGQGIARVELQVLAGNEDAVRFYRELGWHEELVQMVWDGNR